MSSETLTFFVASDLRRVGPGGGDDSESIQVHAIARDSVMDWLARRRAEGVMVDPKVYAGLFLLNER